MNAGEVIGSGVPKTHAQNRGVARHGISRIDFHGAAAANHHHAAARSKNCEVATEVYIRQHFDDHVVAASFGER